VFSATIVFREYDYVCVVELGAQKRPGATSFALDSDVVAGRRPAARHLSFAFEWSIMVD